MSWLRFGPDGQLLLYALFISVVLTVLTGTELPRVRVGASTIAVSIMVAIAQYASLDAADPLHQAVRASFIIVPSVILVFVSRVGWIARRYWMLLLLGPVTFGVCYASICALAYRAFRLT